MDRDEIRLFRQYEWAALWQIVRQDTPINMEGSLNYQMRTALLAAWWQIPPEQMVVPARLQTISDPKLLFLIGIEALSIGNGKLADAVLKRLEKISAPIWMRGWIKLEIHGRKREFIKQAKFLGRLPDESWAYAACIQSLDQKTIDSVPILNHLCRKKSKNPLADILHARLLNAANNADDAISKLLTLIKSLPDNCDIHSLAHYHLGYAATSAKKFDLVIKAFDAAAQIGFMDRPSLERWISISLSHPAAQSSVLSRINHAIALVPDNFRTKASLASNALIYFWINGAFPNAYEVVKRFHTFQTMTETKDDRNAQIFFRYVLSLCAFWQYNQGLYDAYGPDARLHVIGESHALSPANVVCNFLGKPVKMVSHFIMGVKMWHLARSSDDFHPQMVKLNIERLPENSDLMFCIGEIDCRPNEGIWKVALTKGYGTTQIIEPTVTGYLNRISEFLCGRKWGRIFIQGVPAPNYPLEGYRDPGNKQGFLKMIAEVNSLLKIKTTEQGWHFIDVYGATLGEGGISNKKWHIDQYHLKPNFYNNYRFK